MPSSLVVASRVSPVAMFVAVTLASLTTAPLGSVTVPEIVPLLLWAMDGKREGGEQKERDEPARLDRGMIREV